MGGIALGAACVAGFAFGEAGVVAVALTAAVLRAARMTSASWHVLIVLVASAGALRAVYAPAVTSPDWADHAGAVRGVVRSGPLSTRRGQRFDLEVQEVRLGSHWQQVETIACVSAPDVPNLRRGDRVYLTVSTERVEDLREGVRDALSARGCTVSLTAWSATAIGGGAGVGRWLDGLRRSVSVRLQAAAPGDSGSLLAGLVTGDDGALSDDARDAFVATGTSHITAVSGSNVSLIVIFAVTIGGPIGFHRRLLWQALTAGGVWFYALLVGLQPPAFRAALVATGAVFAVRFGRRVDLVTLTVLAAAVQLLIRPADYWTLSFRLSFASALALSLVLHGMSGAGVAGILRTGLVATTAAQVATIPLLISTFGQVSPLSLPANLMISPLVEIAFPVAVVAILVGFVSATLGAAVAVPSAVGADAILHVVTTTAGLGGARLTVAAPGVAGSTLVGAAGISGVAALSAECRRAVRRFWGGVRRLDAPAIALIAIGGLGFAIGFALAAAR